MSDFSELSFSRAASTAAEKSSASACRSAGTQILVITAPKPSG
jgi:hypothetical protein